MIRNAEIVRDQTPPEQYNSEQEPRGSKSFTLRAHVLIEILRNAKRWLRGYESPPSKSMEFGAVLDCLLLTPMQWPKRYAVVPVDAPKKPSKAQLRAKKPSPESVAAIEWWAQFQKEHPGEIVSADLNASVHGAIARLREDKMISELVDISAKQIMITAEWEDTPTGLVVPLKCLIDVVPPDSHPIFGDSLWDLKSTQNASPRSFMFDAQKYRYDVQGAFYLDLWNTATGERREGFGHIIQESYPPFEYRTPPPLMSQRFLQFGRLSYQAALATYCQALASGEWPSYDRKSKNWPLTDCVDYFLDMESLYPPMPEEEPEEDEESAPEPEGEVTP